MDSRPHLSPALYVLTDALEQGVLILDDDENVMHANPAATRRLRIGTRLRAGRPVLPWLATSLGLCPSAVDRLRAGETVAATPVGGKSGGLQLTRVLLPTDDGAPWVAIVIDDRRGSVRTDSAGSSPAFAPSDAALWSGLLRMIERGYDEAVSVALFTVQVDPPAEVTALCRDLCAQAVAGELVGFVEAARDPWVLQPTSLWAVVAVPGCQGDQAAQRRTRLAQQLAESGWRARVGVAVLPADTHAALGGWDAEDRASSLLRTAAEWDAKRAQRPAQSPRAPDVTDHKVA